MLRTSRNILLLTATTLLPSHTTGAQPASIHRIQGAFVGRSCGIKLDSSDVSDSGRPLYFAIDDEDRLIGVPGLLPGHTDKSVVCGDLLMIFEGPRGSLPNVGTYRVTKQDDSPPSGTVTVVLHGNGSGPARPTRFWPDSLTNFDVAGVSGTVRLDRVTKDSLFGRFDVVGRSQAKGP